jgi:hypothetical protein
MPWFLQDILRGGMLVVNTVDVRCCDCQRDKKPKRLLELELGGLPASKKVDRKNIGKISPAVEPKQAPKEFSAHSAVVRKFNCVSNKLEQTIGARPTCSVVRIPHYLLLLSFWSG